MSLGRSRGKDWGGGPTERRVEQEEVCVLLTHCQYDGDGLEVKDEIQSVLL